MNNIRKIFLALLIFFCTSLAVAKQSQITSLKISGSDAYARLDFALTQSTNFHVFTLTHPDRVVIDLKNTRLAKKITKMQLPGMIQRIRYAPQQGKDLRIVLDMQSAAKTQGFFEAIKKFPYHRFVLEIYPQQTLTKTTEKSAQKPVPGKSVAVKNQPQRHDIVIVLDPGHGGKDPGARGQQGIQEKQVVLAIALRLAELINQQPGMRAVLTRRGDWFVPLRQRLHLARREKADLFIAIHADSYFNSHSNGASVFALSRRGATSEAARWLADKENNSELSGVGLVDKSYLLRSVLIDLSQSATIADSLRLGAAILSALNRVTTLHYSHVEQAPFVVLKAPDIPSILIETGFISNYQEEMRLHNSEYQERLAQAMLHGIHQYLNSDRSGV